MTKLEAHPFADKFPMLPEDELSDLAASVKANGLRTPIVLTTDGLILDGRNRAAARGIAKVEPTTIVYDGDDLAKYVIDCNTARRHMSTGARAAATALVLAAEGRRENERWRRGSVGNAGSGNTSTSHWQHRLAEAGVILDHLPDQLPRVVSGEVALDAVFRTADVLRKGFPPTAPPAVAGSHEKVRVEQMKTPKPGARKKHALVIRSIVTALEGLAIAADDITALDTSVTDEEAVRLADDLSIQLRSISRIKTLLTEWVESRGAAPPAPNAHAHAGVTPWSRTVQAVSFSCPIGSLTDDEVTWLHGAADFLADYCTGELTLRRSTT